MLRCNHINCTERPGRVGGGTWPANRSDAGPCSLVVAGPAERVPVTDGEHTVNMLYDMHNFDGTRWCAAPPRSPLSACDRAAERERPPPPSYMRAQMPLVLLLSLL